MPENNSIDLIKLGEMFGKVDEIHNNICDIKGNVKEIRGDVKDQNGKVVKLQVEMEKKVDEDIYREDQKDVNKRLGLLILAVTTLVGGASNGAKIWDLIKGLF